MEMPRGEEHRRRGNGDVMRRPALWVILAVVLSLSACISNGQATAPEEAATITVDELPTGVGRGYPVVELNGIDNSDASMVKGEVPPNFRLRLEDGRHFSLRDLQGKPVLINFWATWCGPCRLEMPEIVAEVGRNSALVVLSVNVQEEFTQLQPFTDDFQMTMPVAQDSDGELRKLYAVRGMPTSIFINRAGKIDTIWTGILTGSILQELVAQIE
ncbi:MAG: TlpA disulfide reductase family protein [Caldilineaceae bacterium]